jgi:MFS family permease
VGVGVLRCVTATSSLWLVFFVNGAVLSSWAPRIPAVAADLELTDGDLGIALFGVAAGSVPTLLLTARLLRRVSAKRTCQLSGVAFAAALPLIALATNLAQLTSALVVLGAASGALDVAMNTAGVHRERQIAPRRILARLHGGYSVGVLAGAAGGALAAALHAPVLVHFTVVTVALLVLMAICCPRLPHSPALDNTSQIDAVTPARAGFPSVLLLVVAVGALLLEGTVTDWSALLVARDLGAGATVGASTVVVFNLAMAELPPEARTP